MASKLVTDRQKSAEAVAAVGETQAAAVGTALGTRLQAYVQPGETAPDFGMVLRLMSRALGASRTAMVTADRAHEAELADDEGIRLGRDTAAYSLYGRMVELREVIQGVYGQIAARQIFPSVTPADPVVLSRFADEVIHALSAMEWPEPRMAGMSIQVSAVVAELQALRTVLDQTLTAVAREQREAQATLEDKNRAMATYDQTFTAVATAMTGLLQLADRPELASKVRPSRSRPGRVADGDGSTPVEPEPGPVA